MSTPIPDFFSLFGLEPRFALDPRRLSLAYQRLQSQVHPDRHAGAAAADRRAALQWATHANEAYQTLKSPLRRAAYLCRCHDVVVDGQGAAPVASDFLMQQLEWREALEAARTAGDTAALARLDADVGTVREQMLRELAQLIDQAGDYRSAADLVRRLMFVEKFDAEIDTAIEISDDAARASRES